MVEHAALFEKRIEKVTDGIYVAVGYALANVIFIEMVSSTIVSSSILLIICWSLALVFIDINYLINHK